MNFNLQHSTIQFSVSFNTNYPPISKKSKKVEKVQAAGEGG